MSAPAAETDTREWRFGHHASLDGLRALAIALVLLFHYPWHDNFFDRNPVHGGFLGVDVFFVLSGFLITSLLLQERRVAGNISLGAFYARRALRLLPAFGVLFVFAVIAHFAFVQEGARPTTAGLLGMLLYASNWVQIWFRSPLPPMFAHTWSLAIEEQFYIVYPLVLLGLLRLGVRRGRLAMVLLVGALASAGWRIVLWRHGPTSSTLTDFYAMVTGRSLPSTDPFQHWNRWYFGTDGHLDGLLLGCAAAVVLTTWGPRWIASVRDHDRSRAIAAVVPWVGVAICGTIVFNATVLDGWIATWGLLVLEFVTVATVVALVVHPASAGARVLSAKPLVWLGRRSYAIYLFHQVVYYELGGGRVNLRQPLQFFVLVPAVLLAGELSWRLVEQPFLRRKARFQRTAEVTT